VRLDSSAPTRIDLAGGTYDIWPLYLFHDRAQTINAALSLRARCTLTSRDDGRIVLISEDTGEQVDAAGPDQLDLDRSSPASSATSVRADWKSARSRIRRSEPASPGRLR
jgi:hypothetical protein